MIQNNHWNIIYNINHYTNIMNTIPVDVLYHDKYMIKQDQKLVKLHNATTLDEK